MFVMMMMIAAANVRFRCDAMNVMMNDVVVVVVGKRKSA